MIRKILLTNDDGLGAVGPQMLATVLSSTYEVYIVAPDREPSGVGHGFTLLNPVRADPAPDNLGLEGLVQAAYKCSGTPVDCVKMRLLALFPGVKFDLVVSGINRGANLAIDTLYSGTVGGAMATWTPRPRKDVPVHRLCRPTSGAMATWTPRPLKEHR